MAADPLPENEVAAATEFKIKNFINCSHLLSEPQMSIPNLLSAEVGIFLDN